MALLDYSRGKIRVICTRPGCGYKSRPYEDETAPDGSGAVLVTKELQAHQDLSWHNFYKHPGVYPRWNPKVQTVEQGR